MHSLCESFATPCVDSSKWPQCVRDGSTALRVVLQEIVELQVLLNIAGAVALLLWAARMVRTGIERAFGPALRRHIARAVAARGRAFASGLFVALALQSADCNRTVGNEFCRWRLDGQCACARGDAGRGSWISISGHDSFA